MSVFILKLIAVVSMLIDHTTYVLRLSGWLPPGQLYIAGRAVGRIAFVLYCFLLVNGFDKTRDRKKYLSRLLLFAVISQLPFTLAFTAANYRGAAETLFSFDALRAAVLLLPLIVCFFTLCERRPEPLLFFLAAAFALASLRLTVAGICLFDPEETNVFYTLAASMAIMMFLDRLFSKEYDVLRALAVLAALGVELYFVQRNADYGLKGVAMITGLYLCRKKRWAQLAVAALWCFVEYRWCLFDYPQYAAYFIGALCALLPIALYNGKLGPKMRSFFYVFYPVHLALLGILFVFILKH
ncbi:MAG: hypothetical protein IJP64_00980 [Oscillospiraceae bacterium]|nr:hypothetical protein [Oscillospiraceae bacterium]